MGKSWRRLEEQKEKGKGVSSSKHCLEEFLINSFDSHLRGDNTLDLDGLGRFYALARGTDYFFGFEWIAKLFVYKSGKTLRLANDCFRSNGVGERG